ncbi:hypothetical protein EC991_006929 [Linnemannia zychae]|nr:hypothetical protein EC991_006929 [Linnemannia zychae]
MSTTPLAPDHTVFAIPELLEKILAYLDQRTLSSSAIFVSQTWLYSARHLITHKLIWHDGWDVINSDRLQKALSRLPWITRVHWNATRSDSSDRMGQRLQWNSFIQALEEIELSGYLHSHMIQSLVSKVPFLTKLTLRFTDVFHPDISSIFVACQQLRDLNISSMKRANLEGPWISRLCSQSPLPLQSLVLSYAQFRQSDLQELLTFTPSLKCLKVINPLRVFDRWMTNESHPLYNARELVRHINTLPLKLDYFHFTSEWDDDTAELCPNATEQTFWRDDFTAAMEESIQKVDNVVTSLELLFSKPSDCKALISTLHRFLCSTPHLLHLKAPQLGYQLEHMDLHVLAFTDKLPFDFLTPKAATAGVQKYHPGIWACRNLQTLHIRIRASRDDSSTVRPLHSRIIFGYIARVCPNLRDLNLTNNRDSLHYGAAIDFRLVGGLCLLGRLKYLERLVIESWGQDIDVQPLDVKWMLPDGRTPKRRQERQRVMAWWTRLIQTEDSIQALPSVQKAKAPMLLDWSKTAQEPRLKASLQHLGSLLDVQLAIEEMDDTSRWVDGDEEGPRWFPMLRYACFANEIGLEVPLGNEVKRLLTVQPKGVQF